MNLVTVAFFILVVFFNSRLSNAADLSEEKHVTLFFSVILKDEDRARLFTHLKTQPVVEKNYPSIPRFHVGLFGIYVNDTPENAKSIKMAIGSRITEEFRSYCAVEFEVGEIGFYDVNRKHENIQAAVIYPRDSSVFIRLREVAEEALLRWNNENGKDHRIHVDYLRDVYRAHITVINSNIFVKYCKGHGLALIPTKEKTAEKVYPLIRGMVLKLNCPNYRYDLVYQ